MNIPEPRLMSDIDAAWLAGIFDGEGCADAPRGNPRLRVKMGDYDVVLRVAALLDGTVHEAVDRRSSEFSTLLVAQVTGTKAIAALRAMLPYLGARRTAKATTLITEYASRQARTSRRHLKGVAA